MKEAIYNKLFKHLRHLHKVLGTGHLGQPALQRFPDLCGVTDSHQFKEGRVNLQTV